MKFKIPSTAKTAFNDFLETAGIEEQVFECEVYEDYYESTAKKARVELYPESSKSRYDNSDARINARFKSTDTFIDKGVMIKDNLGKWYVVDWRVQPQTDNRATRALYCNEAFTFYRDMDEEVDDRGIVIREEHAEIITDDCPCNIFLYDGRPEYSANSSAPGTVSNNLAIITIQFNSQTKDIRIDDYLKFGIDMYSVINVSYSGVENYNDGGDKGILVIQCKKVPGQSESK